MTDEGFAEVASALVESLSYEGDQGRIVRLEELCLTKNRLSATSLQALSPIIRLASSDLRDLDLSENEITIVTEAEVAIWENFLMSFRNCCLLRRIDLSRNLLGPRAFEVMTRAYAKQDAVDLVLPTDLEQFHSKQRRTSTDIAGLGRRVRRMSIVTDPDGSGSDEDNSSKPDGHKVSRNGLSAVSYFVDLVDPSFRCETPRQGSPSSFPTRISTPVRYHTGTQVRPIYCAV